ncbi:MAG TPA: class I SAM-dependent methyltransferase [Acidimicrobiia bacterium]|nr:class I SAM-dependent methyltransferase [Acidimicrobiia bacterium]
MPSPPATDPNRFARELFDGLPERYDRLAEVLSFGQNGRWRRAMVEQVVGHDREPRLVLDVAAGTAGVTIELARRTRGHVVGIDLTPAMLERGRANVTAAGLDDRITLTVGRAEQLPFPDATFDALTFTYLLRYVADPAATLRELARVVRPGAPVANLEFLVPRNPVWHSCWWLYTRVGLPAAGRLAGRDWYDVGRFLGPSISTHYRDHPLAETVGQWRDAGLTDVTVREMSLGGGLVMWGRKAGGVDGAGDA